MKNKNTTNLTTNIYYCVSFVYFNLPSHRFALTSASSFFFNFALFNLASTAASRASFVASILFEEGRFLTGADCVCVNTGCATGGRDCG